MPALGIAIRNPAVVNKKSVPAHDSWNTRVPSSTNFKMIQNLLNPEQKQTKQILKTYWGYKSFLPLQEETISSILAGQDTLTMLATGGGKSLCFQLPALLKDSLTVVISPLISLMKDQVDGLQDLGIAAECLNSSLFPEEQRSIENQVRKGEVKLLYISPERLQKEGMIKLLKSVPLSFFVIDEAHCISHWGHDFREEYRNLGMIKEAFAPVAVHAFTATATAEVRRDILEQLRLQNPQSHIGPVDRPNLTYRVRLRSQIVGQVADLLKKHADEPGIIYCLRRDDVNTLSARLNDLGFRNLPYHAGLADETRQFHQDQFASEKIDIMVATIAFGMGIDRSNIRYVIHTAMPKSIEHYHQETGRAGRDGLPAYCYMFYGGSDYLTWRSLLEDSPQKEVMLDKLQRLYHFCAQPHCRHQVLVKYFDQDYEKASCEACDYCLNELEMVGDPLIIGQKILSCVYRVQQGSGLGFGAGHIANVLKGNQTDQVETWGHQRLSTYGLMATESVAFIRYMIEQLIGQGYLRREGEFSILSLTDSAREVLRGELTPVLVKPLVAAKKKEITRKGRQKKEEEWAEVDQELFHLLRNKRMELAQQQSVPAFIIFGDKSLRDMAMIKPVTKEAFAAVYGVGDHKLRAYADAFIEAIKKYLEDQQEV
ncbi:MAG: DNA helicase RecQ [Deltaproteobacteria bacterium]|nr:MAG: DNA helicase RecQ [Deltaproteobacteria bacterium]